MAAEIFTAISALRMVLDSETDADSPDNEEALTIEDLKVLYQSYDWYFNEHSCDIPIYVLNTQDDLQSILYNFIQIIKTIYIRHQTKLRQETKVLKMFEDIL